MFSVCTINDSVFNLTVCEHKKSAALQKGFIVPVTFIPRKPHPNGLLAYLACSYTSDFSYTQKRPYVLAFHPHVVDGDNIDAFPSLVKTITTNFPSMIIHWFADSWFASLHHHFYTIILCTNFDSYLHDAFSRLFPPNHFRVTTMENGSMLSALCVFAQRSLETPQYKSSKQTIGWKRIQRLNLQLTQKALLLIHSLLTTITIWILFNKKDPRGS